MSDDAGDAIEARNAGWTFGGDVNLKFDRHAAKSIPLYHEGHELITRISDFFLGRGSVCYDLGCATGTLSARLAEHHQGRGVRFYAIDGEEGMVLKTEERCQGHDDVVVQLADVLDVDFEAADLVICYYTMQFVKPKHRQEIFNRIYHALNWGGGLLLFEKVRGPDARFQDMMTSLYTDFKLEQGYTGEEIIAKSRSLKGILEPFSTGGNLDLMRRAGFADIVTVMKYVCFEGFLAIK